MAVAQTVVGCPAPPAIASALPSAAVGRAGGGWLDARSCSDLVARCQLWPGPASSQLGIAIGTLRAGHLGGFAAWLGFTMPSAIVLIAFAYGVSEIEDVANSPWLHGLKLAVVAVVALGLVLSWASALRRATAGELRLTR